MLGGDALQTVSTATTVRVRKGETVTTHGPFAETKEQLEGYYILDCDAETAVEWAAKMPRHLADLSRFARSWSSTRSLGTEPYSSATTSPTVMLLRPNQPLFTSIALRYFSSGR